MNEREARAVERDVIVEHRSQNAGLDGPRSTSIDKRPPVKRYEHGSRVPGWDDAVDLTKPPATVPDPALHLAQRYHGWCSPEAITQVACVMRLTPAYLTSVASFYDMFSLQPKPKNDVFVCTNITCSLLGADEFFEQMCVAAEGHDIGVRGFECLGACDIGPMASVNGEYVGPLNLDDAELIVEDLEAGRSVLEHKQLRNRAVADPQGRVAEWTGIDPVGQEG
jgi:NADH-quinone oxidoreductase subunit E